MRLLPVAAAGVSLALAAGGASITAVGASRHSAFDSRAASLERGWDADVAAGVPAAEVAPLRQALSDSKYQAAWWSPTWWGDTGAALLDSLDRRTAAIWHAAIDGARADAERSLAAWTRLEADLGQFIPASLVTEAATWPSALQAATTPAAIEHLASTWQAEVATARTQALAAQANARTAQLNAQLSAYGGITGLLSAAQHALSTAQGDNLDTGQLSALIAALQDALRTGADAGQAIAALLPALQAERALVALNESVGAGMRPLLLSVDQAAAEQTPDAGSYLSQYSGLASSYRAAADTAQLDAVQQQIASLQGAVNTELAADKCGHNVGSGKVITINLTLQEIVFYQDGCEVEAGPVTTGRAQLRTPTGSFHIFYKQSPFQFISPWPKSSPFYYYPSWTNWVMEFAGGGYFIHDAPWEPDSQLGPGSEDSSGASHGCVHLAGALMQWAYGWTPIGTPVLISY